MKKSEYAVIVDDFAALNWIYYALFEEIVVFDGEQGI